MQTGPSFARLSVPHFRPPAVVQVLTVNEGPSRARRRALVWSALRGSELRQKVSWFPRNDVRRCTDFSDTRYEHCTASSKTARRFRRQAMPLQTEIGKIHTPPGTLPWEPRYLLRPFKPTGEAAGESEPFVTLLSQVEMQPPTSKAVSGRHVSLYFHPTVEPAQL